MILRNSITLVLCILVFLSSCKEENKKTIKTDEVTFTKEGTLSIFKKETDALKVHLSIEIAESEYETQTGLMYRKGMEKDQAMLFIFSDVAMHSFYMKNTAFPLDIIFIDEDLKIASFQENAEELKLLLSKLIPLRGNEQVAEWDTLINAEQWDHFVQSVLETHYDLCYRAPGGENSNYQESTGNVVIKNAGEESFRNAAKQTILLAK